MAVVGEMQYLTIGGNTYSIPTSGGSTVQVVPALVTGTKSATITVDGTSYELYAPTPPVVPTNLSDFTNDMVVSDFSNDAGYIVTETDPTVPSWAKQATKPTYTYSEVGAAASSHGHDIVTSGSSTTSGGFMSQADKQKLDGIAEGATANVGTITGITMNGSSKGTSGVVDLGTVITEHQDISGKADKSSTVTNVAYNSTSKKITKTINGTTSDVVSVATLKTDLGSMPASDVYAWAKAETKPTYTASEVGLGNVGNYKAVSTVANQELTDTEKSNARTNIGAGTSSLTIGTTGSTAAAGNHTHTTSLASDTGTSSITLASAGVYKLTAGETSVIFKMPTIPSVSYPVTSVAGKTGAVTLEASDVGLGNVGNFKAVSTVANQGLTTTEKSNARTNIGAGTSNLTIGTTSSTAAAGNHTHTTSLASDSGTSTITLASAGKYKLTAGDTSVIFTMPTIPTVDYPVTSVAGKTGAVTLTSSDVGLGNVGNFKAVSTVASQGLTDTEKSNARTNIGAGTSNLTLGSTSTTAAAGDHTHSNYVPTTRTVNSKALSSDISLDYSDVGAASSGHTHTLSMATSSGTSSIDLEANTKYQLTAGGSTYIFKTPAGGSSTDSYHTSGSWSGLTYTATAVGNAGTLAFTIPTGTTSTTVSAGNHTHTFASLTSKPTTLSGYGITDGTAANHTHPYDDNYKFVLNTSDALYTAINSMGGTSDVIV